MKKIIISIISVLALQLGLLAASANMSEDLAKSPLPDTAKSFIAEHFADKEFKHAKVKKFDEKVPFQARFKDGSRIDFDANGNWVEIEVKHSVVPEVVIPEQILSYMKEIFAGQNVIKIQKKHWGYEVELGNDMELYFDTEGRFIKLEK